MTASTAGSELHVEVDVSADVEGNTATEDLDRTPGALKSRVVAWLVEPSHLGKVGRALDCPLRAEGRAGLYCPSTAMKWLLSLSRKKNINGTVQSPPISSSTSTPRFFNSAWSARGSNDTKAIPVIRPG